MSEELPTRQDGEVLRITINRPQDGNGMTDAMAVEMKGLLDNAHSTSRVVVVQGAGSDYCIGRASGRPPSPSNEALARRREYDAIFNCYTAFRNCQVPIVSKVRGRALGFGLTIAALSDITIAADTAVFQVPEMGHRILPTMVMSGLVDRVPRKAISYLVYTQRKITPERALSYDIVSDVVPEAELDKTVEEIVATILKAPPPATMGVKEYLRTAMAMDTPGSTDFARYLHAVYNSSSEMKR
jgi:enoyl-CoA hydratase/carnithine racemase